MTPDIFNAIELEAALGFIKTDKFKQTIEPLKALSALKDQTTYNEAKNTMVYLIAFFGYALGVLKSWHIPSQWMLTKFITWLLGFRMLL
jgi:hypothetical protein